MPDKETNQSTINISDAHQDIINGYIGDRNEPREFELFVGPTNSGKTHDALDALAGAKSGAYLGPLRLLATEVFTELNEERGVPCSLLTGEEHREVNDARVVSSTVEMANINRHYDVAVIDETQMLGDEQRGGAWTRAIMGVNADKVCVCCAPEAEGLVKNLIEVAGDKLVETHHLDRMTDIEFDGKIGLNDVKPHDAVVVFSVRGVENIASFLESQGVKCSRIYGAMPPEMRLKEEERFTTGKTDVVVSTDAIGMGLNLPIERVVLSEATKFDGSDVRGLSSTEIKQITGRAGRFGIYDTGHYATFEFPDFIQEQYEAAPVALESAYIDIPREMFTKEEYVSDTYERFAITESDEGSIFENENVLEKAHLASILEYDVWSGANTDEIKAAFFEKAEDEVYYDEYSYRTEWLIARDEITVEGLVDTKGEHTDTIRRFAEFPIDIKNSEVIDKWETLFHCEVTGEPLGMSIREFCMGDDRVSSYMSKEELEGKVKVCDMVAYYEQRFGTEKGYQEARELRNEYIKELGGRLDAEDEPKDKVETIISIAGTEFYENGEDEEVREEAIEDFINDEGFNELLEDLLDDPGMEKIADDAYKNEDKVDMSEDDANDKSTNDKEVDGDKVGKEEGDGENVDCG